jgi:hypothetical protein
MTWNTQCGERTLTPAEAKVFLRCLRDIVDFNPEFAESYIITEGPFDDLTAPQKFGVLLEVARALVEETECPTLTSINESAVHYVYEYIRYDFRDWAAMGEEVWGEDIIAACQGSYSDMECLALGCGEDSSVWENALEHLEDRILWDRDFQMYKDFAGRVGPDGRPLDQQTEGIFLLARISRDYFVSPENVPSHRGALKRLDRFLSDKGFPTKLPK